MTAQEYNELLGMLIPAIRKAIREEVRAGFQVAHMALATDAVEKYGAEANNVYEHAALVVDKGLRIWAS